MKLVRNLWRRNAALTLFGLLFLAAMVPLGLGVLVDPRGFGGAPVWMKPTKFALSLGVYALTLAWFSGYARPAFRRSGWAGGATLLVILTSLFELIYIAWRASRGEASHFNFTSHTTALLYNIMGGAAVTLTACSLVFAVGVWRGDQPIGAAYRVSVISGLLLGFLLGTAVGIILGASGGHWIGGDQSDATGLPLMGWSTTGGDLRIGHFFGLHALQIIPLFGLLVNRLERRLGVALVVVFSPAYAVGVIWLTAQALSGHPPWAF